MATGPRSCQSGRNPVGISPGFSWESHCRLPSSRRPEKPGEAGSGGRVGAGGEEEEEEGRRRRRRRRRRTLGGRGRRGRRRGAAAEPLAPLRRASLQILRELQPRESGAPTALYPNFSCSYIPSHLIYSSKIRNGAATRGRSPRRSKTTAGQEELQRAASPAQQLGIGCVGTNK